MVADSQPRQHTFGMGTVGVSENHLVTRQATKQVVKLRVRGKAVEWKIVHEPQKMIGVDAVVQQQPRIDVPYSW